MKPTPWSRLPARSVRGRAPPALAHPLPRPDLGDVFYLSGAGGRDKSIISFQRGAWRPPPLAPPTVYSFASQRKLSAMGVQGGLRHCQINGGKGSLYKRGFTKGEASPPPLELDYIKPSPSRTSKVRIIAFVPLREGAGGWEALVSSKAAGETRRRPHKSCPACGKILKSS